MSAKAAGAKNSKSAMFHSSRSRQVSVPIRQPALTRAVLITLMNLKFLGKSQSKKTNGFFIFQKGIK